MNETLAFTIGIVLGSLIWATVAYIIQKQQAKTITRLEKDLDRKTFLLQERANQ